MTLQQNAGGSRARDAERRRTAIELLPHGIGAACLRRAAARSPHRRAAARSHHRRAAARGPPQRENEILMPLSTGPPVETDTLWLPPASETDIAPSIPPLIARLILLDDALPVTVPD